MIVSACGLICTDCHFYNNPCTGCYKVKGKTFWAQDATPNGICPLYQCSVNEKGFQSCGMCSELPCRKFMDLKDPNITEEEHIDGIKKRTNILKSN